MPNPEKSSESQHPFLRGGGEAGAIIRAFDWEATSLGSPDSWPQSLRTTIGILLHSAVPMFLIWGPDLISFYNDAYRPSLGNDGRHPCIGLPADRIWPEAWPFVGPQIRQVLDTGETIYREHQKVPVFRNGKAEDVYWTYSYSPVLDGADKPAGVFISCMETTDAVLTAADLEKSEQRFRALVTTTADLIFRVNADWSEMWELDGKGVSSSEPVPTLDWLETYIHPDDRERVRNDIANAIRKKKTFQLEHGIRRADGSTGWAYLRAVPMLDASGAITEWFGAATDITGRRQIEEDLRSARDEIERRTRLYETITDSTPDLVYVFDLNYRFTYANKALLDMWGRSWEDSIGQGLRALGYEDWHATMHEREIDQVVETRKRVRGTVTFPHAELGRRYYDYILSPVIGDSGEVEAVAGTTRDVTDFKYVEAALRESEERFRLMADAIPEIIWVADAEGRAEFMNRRWEEYCGVKFEPSTHDTVAAEFLHPDDAPLVTAAFSRSLQTGEPLEVEQRNRSASGEYRWFLNRATPYRDPMTGRVIRWFGIGTDIHDRKRIEEALKESENRFRNLAENAPVWIWMTDPEVGVKYANRDMLSYLGLPDNSSFAGYVWEGLTHPDDIAMVYDVFGAAASSRQVFSFECRMRNAVNGEFEWCLFRGVPHTEKGEFSGFIGTGLYIHDRKILQEGLESLVAERTIELEYSNKELHRSNEDLQQFAHVASHDLKEPVRKILTFTNMLEGADGAQLSTLGKLSLEKVRSAAERMMNMVSGVLAYSQLAAIDQPLQRIQLSDTIANVEADLEVLIVQKNAQFRKASLPAILGAPVLIHQLFYNLLNNALKFAREGVPPEISVTARPAREGMVEICVADNGIGFEQEYAERIFKTFTRLHSKDQYEGTGLGLSLCKRIVERHGGQIRAESTPGAGTSFLLTLPLASEPDLQSQV